MKKRILVGALIISLMSSIFAAETKYDSFGLHFSVPLLFETATENGAKTENKYDIHRLWYTCSVIVYRSN